MTRKSLKSLFLAHREELQAYLTGRFRDADMAADLTQETFLRFAEQEQGTGAAVSHDRSYLYRTAHNLAVDHFRREARRKTNIVSSEALIELADGRSSIEDAAAARQDIERLSEALAELPERTRTIFALTRIDGLTYPEVAARLGVSESTVQKHLSSALLHVTRRLKRQMVQK